MPKKTSAARSKRADATMPRTNRASRCTYSEGGRRCVKDGDGNPPLCRAHQIAVAAIFTQQSRTPGQRVVDLVNDFLSGKRVSEKEALGVAQDLFEQWGGMAGGFRPPINQDGSTGHTRPPRWSPEDVQDFLRSQGSARPSNGPPPVDPEQEALRVARLRARKVLGFSNNEKLTQDVVKQRHRSLAKRNHPDLGGSTQKMATINNAADVLLADPEIR